jgi:hypothetical protein
MPQQDLEVYANTLNTDVETGVDQRLLLTTEEFRDGILKGGTLDAQTWNQMMFLLTTHSAPHPTCPYLVDTSVVLSTDIALDMDGVTVVTANDNPNLHAAYGSPLPDLSGSAPAGFKYIVRNS